MSVPTPSISFVFTAVQGSRSRWKIFFYVTSASSLCALVVFLILGEGEVQPWARPNDTVDVTVNGSDVSANAPKRFGYSVHVDEDEEDEDGDIFPTRN